MAWLKKDPFLEVSRADTPGFTLFPRFSLIGSLSIDNYVIGLFLLPFTWSQRERDKSYFHIEALLEAILGGRRCLISLPIEKERKTWQIRVFQTFPTYI